MTEGSESQPSRAKSMTKPIWFSLRTRFANRRSEAAQKVRRSQAPFSDTDIVYLPDWTHVNPYQTLLYKSLAKHGISARAVKGKNFRFSWLRQHAGKVQVLHFHWLHGVYDPYYHGLTFGKAALFAFKILAARCWGYKIFWTIHNLQDHESRHKTLERALSQFMLLLSDKVIVHCEFAKDAVLRRWFVRPSKVAVIPHGSYHGHYPNSATKAQARDRIGVPRNAFTFLFFGMLRGYKGVDLLISAFTQVHSVLPDTQLIIAGGALRDSARTDIERLASKPGIILHPDFVPDPEVQFYLNAADAVVLPYRDVLTSGAALLALTFGKPVIAPKMGCLPELVTPECGILYEDEAQLGEVMTAVAQDKEPFFSSERIERMGEEIKWDKLVQTRYLNLFQHAIQHGKQSSHFSDYLHS